MAQRVNRTPALIVSITLHVLIVGASLVAWPWKKEVRPLSVTPVTLMTSAQLAAEMSATEVAPVPTPAQTPEPDPTADPAPLAETPTPEPTPTPAPAPRPAPQPAPRPVPAKPAPPAPPRTPSSKPAPNPPQAKNTSLAKPAPNKPAPAPPASRMTQQQLLDMLTQNSSKPGGRPRSTGDPGQQRLQRTLRASAESKAATDRGLGLVSAKLMRIWNPNCDVAGAEGLQVRVRLYLARDGSLSRPAQLVDYANPDAISDPVLKAAALRALSAAGRGAPYEGLPPETYDEVWKQFMVKFDGKQACNR